MFYKSSYEPLVSIIVPTYNRKELLVEAVESALNQTWPNIEVIVIDDGSTDGTEFFVSQKIMEEWRGCVQYVKQNNSGASAARNKGVATALGRYIQFLDSDDLLEPDKIAKEINLLEQPENTDAACCCSFGRMGMLARDQDVKSPIRIGCYEINPIKLIRQLSTRTVHGMQTTSPLWRRDFLLLQDGWREDIGLGDDLEYYVRLLASAKKILFIDETLFFVREHPDARLSTSSLSVSSVASVIKTRRSVYKILENTGQWDEEMQVQFLHALRGIYANCLAIGDANQIHDIENWILDLASYPKRKYAYHLLILIRRWFGGRVLLSVYEIVKKGLS